MSTAVAVAAVAIVAIAGVGVSLSLHAADGHSMLAPLLSAAVVASFALVGALVAFARPANLVGWAMLAGAVAWALGIAASDAAHHGIVVDPGSVPAASALAVAGSAVRALGWFIATVGVALVFPHGRLPTARHRRIVWLFGAAAVTSVVGVVTASDANQTSLGAWHNPIALPASWQPASGLASVAGVLLGAAAALGAVALVVDRWRRGAATERQQLLLFALAAPLPIVVAPLVLGGVAGGWLFSAAALPLPFAVGFAVLARGLYDLKTAVNRTLVWVTLSAIVLIVGALVVVAAGSLFDASGAAWLPWLAAGCVAVVLIPLHAAVQRAVNRLSFGRWDEPYDILAGLGQRLEAAADIDGLLAHAVAELQALGLSGVTIRDVDGRALAGGGTLAGTPAELPLAAFGRPVGTLSYATETALRARDLRLLDDLAGHLGGVLHAHQLTADLQRALERLVVAREEERRRLRRDLHDGLGPALAGHLLRLDLIAGSLDPRSRASAEVGALREELHATVLEVRRVVEGLRPPALDDLGLAGALGQVVRRSTAGTPLVVDLQVAELPSLPAAMEVATFRIVSEAVTNVVRHAGATTCRVTVEIAGAELHATVEDDGCGIDPERLARGGHGLQTMRERAEELRGRLHVVSAGGTTVALELPLPAGVPAAPGAPQIEVET